MNSGKFFIRLLVFVFFCFTRRRSFVHIANVGYAVSRFSLHLWPLYSLHNKHFVSTFLCSDANNCRSSIVSVGEKRTEKRIWKSDWKESPATDTHEWSTFKDFRRTLWIWMGKCKNCMQRNSKRAEGEKKKKRKTMYKEHLHRTTMIYSILLNDKWFCWMYFTVLFFIGKALFLASVVIPIL